LIGSVISIITGIGVGLVLGLNRWAFRFFFPLVNFFQSVAEIGWLPLFVIWFGFGLTTIVFVIFYTIFFAMVLNTMLGVQTVPQNLVNSLLTLGGKRRHIILEVLLPGALPNIVTGVRVGIGYGWRALIAAEMLVGETGLGFMIFDARKFNLTQRIILGMLMIGLLWLLTDRLILKPIEAKTVERWGTIVKAT
jgi:NitT/TauT family transport system permease protein/taurine transport system permease protein